MASSSTSLKTPCATCGNKGAGIFRCEGCIQVFCRKHLNEHRDILSHQLDEIVLEHDTLQQTIIENKDNQNNQHPILKEIDKWERDSILKIQQMAEETREQVKKLSGSKQVSNELHELAEQLQNARIHDDYVETDLRTWTNMLQKLKDDMNTLSSLISIEEDPTQILIAKLNLITSEQRLKQHERFGKSVGNIRIEENGLKAIHCGQGNGIAYVRGVGEYSSSTHKILFMFKKSSTLYTTWFQVVSKLQPINILMSDPPYESYGWGSSDEIMAPNIVITANENFRDMIDQTTFEIELHLDCDNRKISYINRQTKNRRELMVDITKCPFPWQLEFYLFEVGDYVHFLP